MTVRKHPQGSPSKGYQRMEQSSSREREWLLRASALQPLNLKIEARSRNAAANDGLRGGRPRFID
jgi:hypothetical protein